MEFSFAAVSLEAINPTDHAFRISTTRDKPSIDESIRTDGLLVPPALYRQGADWIVISGFRRINACMQAGHRMVSARLLADHLSPLACLRLAIIENSSQRKLNLVGNRLLHDIFGVGDNPARIDQAEFLPRKK